MLRRHRHQHESVSAIHALGTPREPGAEANVTHSHSMRGEHALDNLDLRRTPAARPRGRWRPTPVHPAAPVLLTNVHTPALDNLDLRRGSGAAPGHRVVRTRPQPPPTPPAMLDALDLTGTARRRPPGKPLS